MIKILKVMELFIEIFYYYLLDIKSCRVFLKNKVNNYLKKKPLQNNKVLTI